MNEQNMQTGQEPRRSREEKNVFQTEIQKGREREGEKTHEKKGRMSTSVSSLEHSLT